jgi:hypothetical protein
MAVGGCNGLAQEKESLNLLRLPCWSPVQSKRGGGQMRRSVGRLGATRFGSGEKFL